MKNGTANDRTLLFRLGSTEGYWLSSDLQGQDITTCHITELSVIRRYTSRSCAAKLEVLKAIGVWNVMMK